ncbi:hypothetical protein EKO27_g3222 [Xylaria grammica]|uniref:Uncharacterized protein n=1 Tax=Xylaria grammica TaxID=363999 RepID=A0A439DBY2_9PEZI|nr:hypothetical protein EKO27_g3222 [Xylaria grammica]
MCIKTYKYFSRCDHVTTTLTTCPTYHKQQAATGGFFGSLFRRSVKKKKDCGKVVPHHLQNEAYCQACSVKRERFRARELGQGALRVRKQGLQEVFQEERKEAARTALHKVKKQWRKSNHDVIHVESSVWLANLYDHPETLAKKDAYAREAACAPAFSPPTHEKSAAGERGESERVETRTSQGKDEEGRKQRGVGAGYSGRFANNSLSIPPAVGLPPGPRRSNRSSAAGAQGKTQATERPKLRHKPGRVHNSASIHSKSKQQRAIPSQDRAAAEAALEARVVEQHTAPTREHVGHWRTDPSRWETGKATISNLIEKTKERASWSSDDSDSGSFVCKTSRVISDQQAQSTGARRSHRK